MTERIDILAAREEPDHLGDERVPNGEEERVLEPERIEQLRGDGD